MTIRNKLIKFLVLKKSTSNTELFCFVFAVILMMITFSYMMFNVLWRIFN